MESMAEGIKLFQKGSKSFKKKVLKAVLGDYEKMLKKKLKKEEKERIEIKRGIIRKILDKIEENEDKNLKFGSDISEEEVNDIRMALNVIKESIEVPDDLRIVIVKNPKMCRNIDLGLRRKKMNKFLNKCKVETTSFAYRIGREDFVVFRISKENKKILKDLDAIIGLLAHEIMHTIARRKGEVKEISDSFKKEFITFFEEFVSSKVLKVDYEKKVEIAKSIGNAAILSLKDLYVNSEIINKGLGDYLLAYYLALFSGKGEKPIKIEEMGIEELVNACLFSLYMLPLLQFRYYRSGERLIELLKKRYKTHIDFLYKFKAVDFVVKNFNYSEKFQKGYFRQIFSDVKEIIENYEKVRR